MNLDHLAYKSPEPPHYDRWYALVVVGLVAALAVFFVSEWSG